MQVELYLEDDSKEYSHIEAENFEGHVQISAQTWEERFNSWWKVLKPDIVIAPTYEIGLRLTTDAQVQLLNAQYRQQNQPTDVLAFAALDVNFPQPEEMFASESLYLGDIVISVDTAKRQAQQQEHPLSTELTWLASHGLLHLLGWDHPDEESLNLMLNQQVILLKTIGITIDLE